MRYALPLYVLLAAFGSSAAFGETDRIPAGTVTDGAAGPPAAAAAAVVDDQCLRDQLRHARHELQQYLCRHRTDHRHRRRWEQRTVQPVLYDAATGLQAGLQQSIAQNGPGSRVGPASARSHYVRPNGSAQGRRI